MRAGKARILCDMQGRQYEKGFGSGYRRYAGKF